MQYNKRSTFGLNAATGKSDQDIIAEALLVHWSCITDISYVLVRFCCHRCLTSCVFYSQICFFSRILLSNGLNLCLLTFNFALCFDQVKNEGGD